MRPPGTPGARKGEEGSGPDPPTGTSGASCLRPPRVLDAEGVDGRGRSPLQHPLRSLPREAGDTQTQNNGGAEARRRGAEFSCRGPGENLECPAEPLPYQAGRQEDGQAERAAWASPQPPSPRQLLQACPSGALAVITRAGAAPSAHTACPGWAPRVSRGWSSFSVGAEAQRGRLGGLSTPATPLRH